MSSSILCGGRGRYLELEERPKDKWEGRDLRIFSRGARAFEEVQLYEPAASGRRSVGGWRGERRKACCKQIYVLPLGTRQ